jgi:uncharacterized protein (TIGR02996 family)
VTTEDDFQAAIDAHPEDWQTRLVFADWLDERGDPRAEGYRALVAIGRRALPCRMLSHEPGKSGPIQYMFGSERLSPDAPRVQYALCLIPADWLKLLKGSLYSSSRRPSWKHYHTRREAEDAAALAFARLSAKRRAKLLQPAG